MCYEKAAVLAAFTFNSYKGELSLRLLAANFLDKLTESQHWINYVGLAVILWVAGNMIYEGWVGGENVLGLREVLGVG